MADRLHVTSLRQLQPLLPRHPSFPHTLKWSNITSANPPKGNLNRKENLCLLYASYRQIGKELSYFFNHLLALWAHAKYWKFCSRDYLAAQQNPDKYSNNMDKNSKDGFVLYMMVAMATRPWPPLYISIRPLFISVTFKRMNREKAPSLGCQRILCVP